MSHSGALSSRDQAAGLRSLMARQGPRLVTVCESRQPGLRRGIASALAGVLVGQGHSVVLFDDAKPDRLRRWLSAQQAAEVVIPLSATPNSLGELIAAQGHEVLDVVLVDALGEGKESVLAGRATDILLVLPGNDASGVALTSAYAIIKYWHIRYPGIQFRVLVTELDNEVRAYEVFGRLAAVAARYLTVKLSFAGFLPPWTSLATLPVQLFERLAINLRRWSTTA